MCRQKLHCLNIKDLLKLWLTFTWLGTWINVHRWLRPPLVTHGPGGVDEPPVGGAGDALIGPPWCPGVWLGQGLTGQHKNQHHKTQLHLVFLVFKLMFIFLLSLPHIFIISFTLTDLGKLRDLMSEINIPRGWAMSDYEWYVVSCYPAHTRNLASWDDVLLPHPPPILSQTRARSPHQAPNIIQG